MPSGYSLIITITAYKAAWQTLHEGMSQDELARNITVAFHKLGADGDVSVQFGQYTAYPHGSATPQHLKDGDVVMTYDRSVMIPTRASGIGQNYFPQAKVGPMEVPAPKE